MKYSIIAILLVGLLLFGCDGNEKKLNYAASDASGLFPHSSNYSEQNVDKETNTVVSAAMGAALASNPDTAVYAAIGINRTMSFLNCLNQQGVSKVTLYKSKTDTLSAGVYAVGKEDAAKILTCAALSAMGQSFSIVTPDRHGLCGAKLTVITSDNNKFHIIFLGTSEKMCKVFCDSQVNGCTWSSDVGYQWIDDK